MPARQTDNAAEYEDVPMTPERRKFLKEMRDQQAAVNAEYDRSAAKLRKDEEDFQEVSPEDEKALRQQAEDEKFQKAAAKAFGEKYAKGGKVKAAKVKAAKGRGDGCCTKGKTKGRFV